MVNRPMEPRFILRELSRDMLIPDAVLIEAMTRQSDLAPLFIETLEAYATPSPATRNDPTPLLPMFFLLAQWGEPAAYRPLTRLLRSPDTHFIMGAEFELILPRVLAAVFDGDPEPLYEMLLDPSVDQFMCVASLQSVAILVNLGKLSKASANAFVEKALGVYNPKEHDFHIEAIARLIVALGLHGFTPLIREALEIADSEYFPKDFEKDLERATVHPEDAIDEFCNCEPVTDAATDLVRCYQFPKVNKRVN
jgi:hypothetical protein